MKLKNQKITQDEVKLFTNNLLKGKDSGVNGIYYLHTLNGKTQLSIDNIVSRSNIGWLFAHENYVIKSIFDFEYITDINANGDTSLSRVYSLKCDFINYYLISYLNKEINKETLYNRIYFSINTFIDFSIKETVNRNIEKQLTEDLGLIPDKHFLKMGIKSTHSNKNEIAIIVGNYVEKESGKLEMLSKQLKTLETNEPEYSKQIFNYMKENNTDIYNNYRRFRVVRDNQNIFKTLDYPTLYDPNTSYWEYSEIYRGHFVAYSETIVAPLPNSKKEYKEILKLLKTIFNIVNTDIK